MIHINERVSRKKIPEERSGFPLQDLWISAPGIIPDIYPLNFISTSPHNGLGVENLVFLSPNLTHFSLDF